MPTYTCWSKAGVVTTEACARIAAALTRIHHDVAAGPRYFVQVIFTELSPDSLFIAGKPVTAEHVWIRADIRAGRTEETKAELLRQIVAEVSDITGVVAEHVWVYLNDVPGPNIAEYGRPLPNPGQEDQWFEQLPRELQERLRTIAE